MYPEAYPIVEENVVEEELVEVETSEYLEPQLQVVEPSVEKVEPPHFFSYPRHFQCRKCNLTVECKSLEQSKAIYYFHKRYGCQLVQINPGKTPKIMGRRDLVGIFDEKEEEIPKITIN